MKMRLWLLLCACACIQAYKTEFYSKFICNSPLCKENGRYQGISNFTIEGHPISFGYSSSNSLQSFDIYQFELDCHGWVALDSGAMPSFETAFKPAVVELKNCPPPADGASIVSKLASYNVKLRAHDAGEAFLLLRSQPAAPQLSASHLRGLESLTTLSVMSAQAAEQLEPAAGFLSGLSSLRALALSAVQLPPGEFSTLPSSLVWLRRTDRHMNTLHETISALARAVPSLRYLKLSQDPHSRDLDFYDLHVELHSALKLLTNQSSLEFVEIASKWTEKKLAPLKDCGGLRSLKFYQITAEELPARWVAACPLLEELVVYFTEHVKQFPDTMLEGARSLRKLTIMRTQVTHLPDGFLKDCHNLKELTLSVSKLRTLSSGAVAGAAASLQEVDLSDSELDNSALAALGDMKNVEKLWLEETKFSGDLCYDDEFAALRNLPKLRTLRFPNTVVVCKYWRSRFHVLDDLYPRPSYDG